MMQMDKSHKLSIPEFDDISNISSCNSISKQNKREELNAIKDRLNKLAFKTGKSDMLAQNYILPKDLWGLIYINNDWFVVVVSANGDTHLLSCQDTGHEETYFLLVVMPNGVDPIFFILLSLMHFFQHTRVVWHCLSFLQFFNLLMHIG